MIRNLGFLYPRYFPDTRIRNLGALSGFLKFIYLDPTWSGKFLDAKIFLYKFRPGSGFAPKSGFSVEFPVFQFFFLLLFSLVLTAMEFYSLFRLVQKIKICAVKISHTVLYLSILHYTEVVHKLVIDHIIILCQHLQHVMCYTCLINVHIN